jgi:flagellar motor protein MotB
MHRVSVLGMGAESPVADNKSRQGRKQNRRVEVRVYTAAANQQHSAQAR